MLFLNKTRDVSFTTYKNIIEINVYFKTVIKVSAISVTLINEMVIFINLI